MTGLGGCGVGRIIRSLDDTTAWNVPRKCLVRGRVQGTKRENDNTRDVYGQIVKGWCICTKSTSAHKVRCK